MFLHIKSVSQDPSAHMRAQEYERMGNPLKALQIYLKLAQQGFSTSVLNTGLILYNFDAFDSS
jgi:hypothetical protein